MKCFFLAAILILGFQFEAFSQTPVAAKKQIVKKETSRSAAKSFVIGGEIRNYTYLEPEFVKHSGLLYGIWGEWFWASALGSGKLYGNFLYGVLKYDGALCDVANVCEPHTAPTTDMITKVGSRFEFDLNPSFQLFIGAGFRYLYDKGEGAGFYQRTGQWVHIPVGAAFNLPTTAGKLMFELEYDQIIYGQIKSNLSEARSDLSDLTHNQSGYGLQMSAGYQITPEWRTYLTYEIWELNETDRIDTFYEPKNNSHSYGLRLGYLF